MTKCTSLTFVAQMANNYNIHIIVMDSAAKESSQESLESAVCQIQCESFVCWLKHIQSENKLLFRFELWMLNRLK